MTNPTFIYGTAWKEERTEPCVLDALKAGYRAFDSANQRKHYFEEAMGQALSQGLKLNNLKREDLFIQTKFTFARGQDHRKPYDETAPFNVQVQQSFESSLKHLQTDYLDSFLLHGPSQAEGLAEADFETWGQMEKICKAGGAKNLGISNVSLDQLVELFEKSSIKPKFVQNRCFAETYWDKQVRDFCAKNGIAYQAFSLLTANSQFLAGKYFKPKGQTVSKLIFTESSTTGVHPKVQAILKQARKDIQQVIFRFAQQVGMIPIAGTSDPAHMKSNLDIGDFKLSEDQIQTLEDLAFLEY